MCIVIPCVWAFSIRKGTMPLKDLSFDRHIRWQSCQIFVTLLSNLSFSQSRKTKDKHPRQT